MYSGEASQAPIELRFNPELYAQEESLTSRVGMAENYLREAEGTWLHAYSQIHSSLKSARAAGASEVQRRIEEVGRSESFLPTQRLKTFIQFQQLTSLLKEGADAQEDFSALDAMVSSAWLGFRESLSLGESLPTPYQETLEWLKGKIAERKVLVLSSSDIKEEDERATFLQNVRRVGTPLSIATRGDLPTETQGTLLILPDLIDQETSGVDLMQKLVHEKAHEDLKRFRKDKPSTLDETELVMSEFYPMMEEQRAFRMLTENQRDQLNADLRAKYELPEDERGVVVEGKLPIAELPYLYPHNQTSRLLFLAYAHALAQIERFQEHQTK